MEQLRTFLRSGAFFAGLLLLAACGDTSEQNVEPPQYEEDLFPLENLDSLTMGVPDQSTLEDESGKADEVLPAQFDVVETQSPVKSQGSRGVCSIFATAALAEHLYIAEGTITDPDFSEQFLQWSTKFEYGSFQETSGSNSRVNIATFNQHGVVFESDWPYETSEWGTSDDEACTGDDRPTRCYTNGEPPMEALDARRWRIPRGRWLRANRGSIKNHIFTTGTAVQVGGDFYYQAWNHGSTQLERSSEYRAYRDLGYVVTPNEADIEDSSGDRRAGHSFILVGWDDDLEVQAVDENGELAVDEDGVPVMIKGFFLFKNSWGTGWARNNPHGPGYGWISYAYVERFLSAYVSGLPEVNVQEVCGDGEDNDFNGATDCDDAACAASCAVPQLSHSDMEVVDIPDYDETGITRTAELSGEGVVQGVTVSVDITHPYRGDLTVTLKRGETVVVLTDRDGGGEDDFVRTLSFTEFDGLDIEGEWTLSVVDHLRSDVGTLNSWSLEVGQCTEGCGERNVTTYSNDTLTVIPDGESAGGRSAIEVADGGTISAARVTFTVSHEFIPELIISLVKDGGEPIELVNELYVEDNPLTRTIDVEALVGESAAGNYELVVVDTSAGTAGTLDGWSLELTR